MKALISILFGTWMLALCGGLQAQTKVITTSDPIFTRAELDQMLAPIALYPDTVLSHILIAATYPLEVVQADRWARANRHLDPEAAVNAAALEGWDPSVAALVAFPDILARMSDDLTWTQNLGDAFLADEERMMDAIQNLREKAYASGNLKKMKHVKVHRENQIIIIEPTKERVVYVPYYDTRVVYGHWWWDSYPPIYWHAPSTYVQIGGFFWGPRITLGPTFFFSSVHWPQRRIVVIDYRHQKHPHFYSSRKIAHYHGARPWQHNPVHRHNIVYRSEPVRQRYSNHSGTRRFSNEWRNEHRAPERKVEHRAPDRKGPDHRGDNRRDQDRTSFRDGKRDPNVHNNRSDRDTAKHIEQRRDQAPGQRREFTQEERQRRAEHVRERLASNGRIERTEGNRPAEQRAPAAQERRDNPERRASQERRDHNVGTRNTNVRQDEQRPRPNAGGETRREQTRSTPPPQNVDRGQQVKQRREQAPSRREITRESTPRVEPSRRMDTPARQERVQPPPRVQQQVQQPQRRFDQPSRHQAPSNPRPAEHQRRFER